MVDDKPLVIASPNDMTTLDPHAVTGMFPYRSLTYWMFDVLVTADRLGQPVPELATEWKRIDPLTWEFKLAQNAKFQNGEPFNADAVVQSFERMKNEELASYNQIFRRTTLKEIKVIDDYTIQMITEKSAPEFLYWLSESFIVPPKYYAETDLKVAAENRLVQAPIKWWNGSKTITSPSWPMKSISRARPRLRTLSSVSSLKPARVSTNWSPAMSIWSRA
ncbi:MAG: ABC transporter substrate-binding protein [Bacillus subtilis]|nr:ABC transporter substrate-binding protein [Bacillus subtilis]